MLYAHTHKEASKSGRAANTRKWQKRKCEKRQPIQNNLNGGKCTVNYIALAHFYVCANFVNHCFVSRVHFTQLTIDTFLCTMTHIVTVACARFQLSLRFRFRSDFIRHAFYLNFIAGDNFFPMCSSLSVSLFLLLARTLTRSISLDFKWFCAIVSIVWTDIVSARNRKCETMATKWNSFVLVPRRDRNCQAARSADCTSDRLSVWESERGSDEGEKSWSVWSVREIIHSDIYVKQTKQVKLHFYCLYEMMCDMSMAGCSCRPSCRCIEKEWWKVKHIVKLTIPYLATDFDTVLLV